MATVNVQQWKYLSRAFNVNIEKRSEQPNTFFSTMNPNRPIRKFYRPYFMTCGVFFTFVLLLSSSTLLDKTTREKLSPISLLRSEIVSRGYDVRVKREVVGCQDTQIVHFDALMSPSRLTEVRCADADNVGNSCSGTCKESKTVYGIYPNNYRRQYLGFLNQSDSILHYWIRKEEVISIACVCG